MFGMEHPASLEWETQPFWNGTQPGTLWNLMERGEVHLASSSLWLSHNYVPCFHLQHKQDNTFVQYKVNGVIKCFPLFICESYCVQLCWTNHVKIVLLEGRWGNLWLMYVDVWLCMWVRRIWSTVTFTLYKKYICKSLLNVLFHCVWSCEWMLNIEEVRPPF